jgi:uncharacterized OsmC-like protein
VTSTDTAPSARADRDAALRRIFDGTCAAISVDEAAALSMLRAQGSGADGVLTRIGIRHHELVVDEPEVLGGGDAAANPVEHALAALISCQVVTYRFWAAHLGIALGDVEVSAEADLDARGFLGLDDAVRPGFTDVRVHVRLGGPETAERYQELRRAVDAHCPALDLFGNATPIATDLTLTATGGAA